MIVENLSHLESEVKNTPLDSVFDRFAAIAPREVGKVMDPADVASRIFTIACRHRPRAIYRINNRLALRMLKWLPVRLAERAVRIKLGGGHSLTAHAVTRTGA
jgi:hypothetical protein